VSRDVAPFVLTSALDGGEWSVSGRGRTPSPPRGRGGQPQTPIEVGGWVNPRAVLDT